MNKPFIFIARDEFGRTNQFGWLYGLQTPKHYESEGDNDVYKFGDGDEITAKAAKDEGYIFLSAEEVGELIARSQK